jgi:hypothetical protein
MQFVSGFPLIAEKCIQTSGRQEQQSLIGIDIHKPDQTLSGLLLVL